MTIKNKRIHNTGRLTDSKKRSFGIFTGLALTICSAILIFSGCEVASDIVTNADMAAVNAAIEILDYTSITFEDTEDQDTVRSDFTLPLSGERGTTISWESSNTDMLSIDQATATPGSLKTGEASIEITLTATVSKGSAKQSKPFSITILANANETPGVPTGLSINSWAADSFELEWTEALPGRVNGKAGTIIGYTVYYSTSDDFLDLAELKLADQSIDFGSSTRAEVTGLESGTQYYFAVTAINAYKEGPVSPSLETHTDTPADFIPDAPAIIGRSAGNGQVELTWTAPAATGWKDGQAIAVSGYKIYQDDTAITDTTDTTGLTTVVTGIEPVMRAWTVSELNNGEAYYFALSALTRDDKESLPGGGDVPVTPNENISTIRNILSLSVEDFAALTGTNGQAISVDITAFGLTYGTDYMISISKAGNSVEALVYNPNTQEIDVADTIGPADAGNYTIRASGMGLYNEAVTDDFELTVKLSNTNLLEQALKALSYTDIKFAANEDENSVYSDFTVPLTGLHESSIAWESDNPVVAISGEAAAVDPPDENTVVTLTAELSLNEENASKEFIIVLTHPPNTLPGAPENLAFTSWNTETISLSWSAENTGYVDGSKASISAYTVYYSETGDFSDLTALKNAEQYVKISAAANSDPETAAIISGLTSGDLYYFALSAANSNGEGPLSSSVETHTNSSPGAPVVIGRSAADQAVVLTWAAPAMTGWTDGHEGIISSYDIYQTESAISDLSGLDVLETVNNVNPAGLQSYIATGLDNGRDYYFAVAAVTASGRSLPGGGDLSVSPGTTTDLGTVITLSVEDAAASSNTPDQNIAVSLVDGGLSYGQDYAIAIIKGGRATTALSWDAAEKTIKVSPALSETDDGAYSIIASGMGAYGGNVSDPFTLTVNLSDTDAVAAVQAALDISTEAGGDLNAVTISHIALPIDGPYDTAINWESSDEKVIRADGTVIIPAVGSQDAEVTLTATISKNTANAQKVFTLIVKAQKSTGLSTVPDAIGSIVLSDWSESSVRLDWPEAHPGFIDGNHASISAYTVYYNTSGDFSDLETLANRTVDAGTELYAVPGGLESGKLYYFAVTASNTVGEGPVSQSVSTRTNSLPDKPLITGRIPGNEEVQLSWLAPASAGWKDGAQASIVEYRIYQNTHPIDNVDQLSPAGSVSDMHYTVRSLNNDQTYYFAVTAVNGHGEESFPADGEAALSPTETAAISIQDGSFSLSVENAIAWTNTAGQTIDIDLDEDSLVYGQAYSIVIIKAGSEAPELYYDPGIGKIRVSDALAASLVGDTTYTVTAHGMGGYKDSLTDDFVLTVSLSDADAVAADKRILDISQEAGGNLNAVSIEHISLPANGPNGSTITWSSNNPAVIADDGAVARPLIGTADAVVELTASIRKNSASAARKFTLRVLALRGIANTAPGAPEDLQATPGELKVTLTWIAPDDRGSVWGQSASSLTYSVSGHETLDAAQTIPGMGGIRGTVVEVDNLKANTEYSFYVRASNSGTRSAPATIDATVLDLSDQMEISAVSYTLSTLEPMAGQTIEAISPKLTPDTVKPDDPRLSFAISPTDFEAQTGLDFDENTGRISGTASLTAMSNALDYTITVLPDTGYYKGTPTAVMNIKVIPVLTATWDAITATAFTPGLFGPPSLDSTEWTGSFSAASLPDGLDINPITGEISGAPNGIYAADDYQIELTGRDNYFGVNSSAMINIRVNPKELGDAGFFITDLSHTVVALTEDSAALSIDKAGLTHTDDYTLSIAKEGSAVAALSIDDTGAITIGAGITVSDGGDYTITATGQNDYSGTVTGTFTLTVNSRTLTSVMLGSISNPSADFEIQAGFTNPVTKTLSFDGSLTIDDDYTLAITGRPPDAKPDHLSLDAATAVLTLSTDIVPDDSGEYTLTVSAAGNYTDPVTPLTATFMLTVTKADILSITYSPVTAVFKTAMAQSASPTIEPADAAANASFTISPDLHTNTGLSFDPATGAISGTPTIRASGDYSVSIKGGDGTKYEGAELTSASFSVSIDPKPIEGTLSYDGSSIATTYGTAQALSIQWTGDLPEQTVSYAIVPKNPADPALPDDILFTTGTGALSVSNMTAVHTGTYTVTASGSGDYGGTKSVDVNIQIDPKALSDLSGFSITGSGTVTALTGGSATATVAGGLTHTRDYTLSITSAPNSNKRVTIANNAQLTVGSDITIQDAGDYTITATGQNNYGGQVTGTFNLTVSPIPLTSDLLGSISNPQSDFTVTFGSSYVYRTLSFNNSLTIGSDFSLAITGRPQGAIGSHVRLDSNTGRLTIAYNIVPEDSGTYTLSATGQGNYSGTAAANFEIIVNRRDISTTLSYADLEIAAGQTKKSNASWNNAAYGQTVRYTLVSPPAGISIDETNGVVTVDAAVVTADTRCRIRAEGIGNYTGETTANLKVFIRDWMAPDLTLTYTDIRVYKGSSASSSPQWSNGGPTAIYGIAPVSGGTLPDEISIDPSSGDISVSSSAALQADTVYQVTATATGRWKGWKTAEIRISVYDTFSYEFKPALVGQEFTLPAINASSFEQFAVSPSLPDGLDLNRDSGEIHGTPTTRQLAKEYTITASPKGGGSTISNNVYLFIQEQAVDKDDLWRMIDEEIAAQGNTADLGLIDTSIITDMSHLFNSDGSSHADYWTFNGDLSGWDVSSVTDMSSMFYYARYFNGNLSGWDVSSVTDMSSMFYYASYFNGDLSGWDVSSVTDMSSMFYYARNFNGDLSGWDVSSVTDMSSMFSDARNFNGDISGWDVSSVTDMSSMFDNAEAFNGDLSGWDVSSVTDMSSMFYYAEAFNGDISGWDVSSVTDMGAMFSSTDSFNGDLSGWDVSSVTDMSSMFHYARNFNGDISGWDVSSVTDMSSMFLYARNFNGDLSGWDVSSVTDMGAMFSSTDSFNGDLSGWDVSSVTDMSSMFSDAEAFNGDLSEWDVSSVTDMGGMFAGAASFNGDLSEWDVSSVTNMGYMFSSTTAFNGDISAWDVSSVTSMHGMFFGAAAFNGDLSGWDVSSVTVMGDSRIGMFSGTVAFNRDLSGWDVSSVTSMGSMFAGAEAFNGDISGWDVSSVTSMHRMFNGATAFNGDLSGWDVSSVTDMSYMFYDATNFNRDLSVWDVSSVTSMHGMFFGATAFNGDLSGWDVSSVTDMVYMFNGAEAFKGDLSGWDVSSVKYMWSMFNGAAAFNGDLSGWDVSSVKYMWEMFKGATSFNGDLSGWDVSSVTNMWEMFYGATAFNGDISGWDVSSVTDMSNMFSGSGLENNPPSWYSP